MYLPAARGFDYYLGQSASVLGLVARKHIGILGIPYSDDMGEARATSCESSGDEQRHRRHYTQGDDEATRR